jgi:hypothetical protein
LYVHDSSVQFSDAIPYSNTKYEKYELELFVHLEYDKYIKASTQMLLVEINHTAMRERYDG